MFKIIWYFIILQFFEVKYFLVYASNYPVVFQDDLAPSAIKLTCASEDDESALVWNVHLSRMNLSTDYYIYEDPKKFTMYQKKHLYCEFNKTSDCIELWKTKDWILTDSLKYPFEPIYDKRWEALEEYEFFHSFEYKRIRQLQNTEAIVVSVRGITDAHFLLCQDSYTNSFCYWIIIGGWNNTKSVIRMCKNGVPQTSKISTAPNCKQERDTYRHKQHILLTPYEWKTFVIKWYSDNENINISVYNTEHETLLLTYKHPVTEFENNVHNIQNLYFKSTSFMLFRFHIYNFIHTAIPSTELISPSFSTHNKTFCVQMLISLCSDCSIEIILLSDYSSNQILKIIHGSDMNSSYNLPMWQNIKINFTSTGKVAKLKLLTKLNERHIDLKPFWAVGKIQECPHYGDYIGIHYVILINKRIQTMEFCQKMFNKGSSLSGPYPFVDRPLVSTTNSDNLSCSKDKIGPQCSLSCQRVLKRTTCRNVIICTNNQTCTCAAGFTGYNCINPCTHPMYGHGCLERIGHCFNTSYDYITGSCDFGCEEMDNIVYNPPFCKTEIEKPREPDIIFVNETYVRVSIEAKEVYKQIKTRYLFSIRKLKSNFTEINDEGNQEEMLHSYVTNYTTKLEKGIGNLDSGIVYEIFCTLYMSNKNVPVRGGVKTFMTNCFYSTTFVILKGENISSIEPSHVPKNYPCPAEWYKIHIKQVNSEHVITGSINAFPFYFKHEYDTEYKITINGSNKEIYSTKIRTPEGPPSPVVNLYQSEDQVTINWLKPNRPNGRIVNYKISLQVIAYNGCKNQNQVINSEVRIFNTTLNFLKLDMQPYCKYNVSVQACTSKCGLTESLIIESSESEIPTSVFHNFTCTDEILSWDLPKNCRTISGRIFGARLEIKGISENVKMFSDVKEITERKFRLDRSEIIYGAETYKARLYVIQNISREYNKSAYMQCNFTTKPTSPPQVRNLTAEEFDSSKKTIHLKWKEPRKPSNGEINFYEILSYEKINLKKIYPHENCQFWKSYICATVNKQNGQYSRFIIRALNKNVTEPGEEFEIQIENLEKIPSIPLNISSTVLEKGFVDIEWTHPWISGGRIKLFRIIADIFSTNLEVTNGMNLKRAVFEYSVVSYMMHYKQQISLLPSTKYNVSVHAVTINDIQGEINSASIQTLSSIDFADQLKTEIDYAKLLIYLHVPRILNNTKTCLMNIIIKSKHQCMFETYNNLRMIKEAGIKDGEIAWVAASVPSSVLVGKMFPVGDNRTYGSALNCPLYPLNSYVIIIVVHAELGSMIDQVINVSTVAIDIEEISNKHMEVWLIPFTIFVIAVIVAYVYRRKVVDFVRQLPTQDNTFPMNNIMNNLRENECKNNVSDERNIESCENKTQLPTPMISDNGTVLSQVKTEVTPTGMEFDSEEKTFLVKVKDFEDYVKEAIDTGLLDNQYETFPRGQTKPWGYGQLPQNKMKNRYGNLIAYDETRVVLSKLPNDPFSDYINANYIKGYKKDKSYIATQGPKPNTIIDFWRMIWQENVLIICMLANIIENGKTKCEQYWPEIGKKKKYGDITVLHSKHSVFADYTFRSFVVTCGQENPRTIEHLHYTAWPDHGVPMYTHSIVTYLKKMLATASGSGPAVVHCSAGVGRTGTIILCDICLRRAAAEGVVDVFAETAAIRSRRANMVDNKQQYLLAHLALVECLLSLPTGLPCNESISGKIKELKGKLNIQLQRLQSTVWQDEALRPPTLQKLSKCNLDKNRFPELVSDKVNRVYLKRHPVTDEDSDYISGVSVDGVRLKNQYFASQLPMPETFNDFWRMIAEFKTELIVALQYPNSSDDTCCNIVPKCGEIKPTPYISIKMEDLIEHEYYTRTTVTLMDNSEKPPKSRTVTILCSTEWEAKRGEGLPPVLTMVTLWQAAEKIPRGDGPVVTLCYNGVTGCGLYLAMSFLLERMAVERICDVSLAARAVRRSRSDFVDSLEHLEYLYDSALTFLEYFETYANFS